MRLILKIIAWALLPPAATVVGLILLNSAWPGFIIVMNDKGTADLEVTNNIVTKPLHRIGNISFGAPGITGGLIARCPPGQDSRAYYVMRGYPNPYIVSLPDCRPKQVAKARLS